MSITLISSPLQGFTDFRFRNAFQELFGGIDQFYAPYIRLTGTNEIKPANQRDIHPDNNPNTTIIPQVMTKDAEGMLVVAKYVQELGYKELNWNMGCPYSMVTKRGMGAGLLKNTQAIIEVLDRIKSESDIELSLKVRIGNESIEEIETLLPLLENYPIKHIAIHPRFGKQMYKGSVDLKAFERCAQLSSHKLIYNGDINSVAKFKALQERFPTIDNWMIGRGLVVDPFLPSMIKANSITYPEDSLARFKQFHDKLLDEYSQALSGDKHIQIKMLHYWEYFSLLFSNSHKCLKRIKKASNLRKYEDAVVDIFRNEEIVGVDAVL